MAKKETIATGKVPAGKPQDPDTVILPDGTGTPYLAIFSSGGKPIIDEKNNLPIGMEVTSFNYDYIEDGDDKAEFTFETDNVNMMSHPSLEYLQPIILQWGWLYPGKPSLIGPPRSMVVLKHHGEFSPDGVKITIELVTASFLLKMTPPTLSIPPDTKNLIDYLVGVLKGNPVLVQVVGHKIGYITETKVGRVQKVVTPTPPPETEE